MGLINSKEERLLFKSSLMILLNVSISNKTDSTTDV